MSRVGRLLAVGGILVVFAGIVAIYRVRSTVHNAYSVWWVADMIVLHLQGNDDVWPRSWEDLRDDYETCVVRSGGPWSFEELQQRVRVDWNADAKRLASQANAAGPVRFRVIRLADGSDDHYQGYEPNAIVRDYLRDVASQ